MSSKLDISVVVPFFNEEESLPELVAWIDRVATTNQLSYEIMRKGNEPVDLTVIRDGEEIVVYCQGELFVDESTGRTLAKATITPVKENETELKETIEKARN